MDARLSLASIKKNLIRREEEQAFFNPVLSVMSMGKHHITTIDQIFQR